MSKKVTLITGITGQDGSYLAELLLEDGYSVHGFVRPVAAEHDAARLSRINHILGEVTLHTGSLENYASVLRVVDRVQPGELYHLAAQSFVAASFEDPFSTMQQNVSGTHHVFEAVRECCDSCRVYFAGTSEMFGNSHGDMQDELTPLSPRSPYGTSKVAGYNLAHNYHDAYGLFISTGILFNHESPRRGSQFVTRKITQAVARIKAGKQDKLVLGDLESSRDWGFAGDYVKAMQMMLQLNAPQDFVIATGETHTVKKFCDIAFARAGLYWKDHVVRDEKYTRPAEVYRLKGNAAYARRVMGWAPEVSFKDLVHMMVDHDLERVT